jgi:hypothetical protein
MRCSSAAAAGTGDTAETATGTSHLQLKLSHKPSHLCAVAGSGGHTRAHSHAASFTGHSSLQRLHTQIMHTGQLVS